jgi:hypothetical protein
MLRNDVELDASMSRIPGGGVHVGHGGLRRFWSRWLGAWEEVHSEVIDLTAHGNRVMGEQRLHGTSRQGGVKVDAVVYDVFTLKDGLIVRHALFSEREPAERALEG